MADPGGLQDQDAKVGGVLRRETAGEEVRFRNVRNHEGAAGVVGGGEEVRFRNVKMRQKRPRPSAGRPKSEVSGLSLVPKCGVNSNHHSHRHPHLHHHFVHNDDDQVREDPVREAVRRPLSYIETSPSLPSPLLKVIIWSKMLIILITIDNHYDDLGENVDQIDHD